MRWGVFGDAHGNLQGLQAVVQALRAAGVDGYLNLGDTVGYGADPNACCDLVREIGAVSVLGNHDLAAIGGPGLEWFNETARTALNWTRNHLSADHLAWLANLPTSVQLDELAATHSSLPQPTEWRYIDTALEAGVTLAAAGRRLVTPVYNADLAAGMVTNLALAGQLPLVMQVQYSSAQTGWTSELGEGEFELLYSGPVQAAWRVVKLLAGGVEVTRTVRAGRDVLEVQTTVANSVAGLHNRIYTARVEGQYLDSQGRRATVDGVGEMEIDSSAVDWLSYGNERGGLLMVPDRQLGLSYWDISGWWGGFGFHHHPAASRETWLFGPTPWTTAQADAAAAALATPLVVDWAE
ncbi:MAG TPA: hypothetical protein DCZ72_12340 [Armatimonadetes bacterium]|nr:hypothetical protein [Armatimonadota bacterium]